MDPANTIRDSIREVCQLRAKAEADPVLGSAVSAVKRLQALRFRSCYSDLLESGEFGAASRFFLEELYGDADYSERDGQFARIAGTLASVFPASVLGTAISLSKLHVLTEQLDHQMAECCLLHGYVASNVDSAIYLGAWHSVGRRADRLQQLKDVLELGHELEHLTGKPGVALLLKLMRRPATSAGLGSLQQFLERGFGIFAALARRKGRVNEFLVTIENRESAWMDEMFATPANLESDNLTRLRT